MGDGMGATAVNDTRASSLSVVDMIYTELSRIRRRDETLGLNPITGHDTQPWEWTLLVRHSGSFVIFIFQQCTVTLELTQGNALERLTHVPDGVGLAAACLALAGLQLDHDAVVWA